MIGGTSPESTLLYYKSLINLSREKLPENVYPEILIYSVNFDFVVKNMRRDPRVVAKKFNEILKIFENSGVEVGALTANTMHLIYDMLDTSIEMVHIVDSVRNYSIKKGYRKLVLFGTKRTMESDLYPSKLNDAGIDVVIPSESDREEINDLIFSITAGGVDVSLKERAKKMAKKYSSLADAIILGCTELPLVLKDSGFEVIDTVEVHARDIFSKAVED